VKSLLLLLLESGLSYIVVIESLYSYIFNVNYTEICKLLLIILYKQMGLSRYGVIKPKSVIYVKHEYLPVYVNVNKNNGMHVYA